VESVLGVVTAVTSESIGAVVSVSPSDSSDSSDSSVPPSIPSSFEDEVLHHITSISLFYKNVGRLWRVSDSVKN